MFCISWEFVSKVEFLGHSTTHFTSGWHLPPQPNHSQDLISNTLLPHLLWRVGGSGSPPIKSEQASLLLYNTFHLSFAPTTSQTPQQIPATPGSPMPLSGASRAAAATLPSISPANVATVTAYEIELLYLSSARKLGPTRYAFPRTPSGASYTRHLSA